ncbi:hypothetical protein [Aeromicrobium sp.]
MGSASPFLIGLVLTLSMHGGTVEPAWWFRALYALGLSPTSSANRASAMASSGCA